MSAINPCSVCFCDLYEDDDLTVVIKECGHQFHGNDCLNHWVLTKIDEIATAWARWQFGTVDLTCPICRASFSCQSVIITELVDGQEVKRNGYYKGEMALYDWMLFVANVIYVIVLDLLVRIPLNILTYMGIIRDKFFDRCEAYVIENIKTLIYQYEGVVICQP